MKRSFALSALVVGALSGVATGNVVNLGNLTANYNVQSVPFVVPGDGPYSSYTVTLNWSASLGDYEDLFPWSSEARWNLYDSTGTIPCVQNSFMASGSMGSTDSATLTWTGMMPTQASGTTLSFGYAQTIPGSYDAFFNNVTITFGTLTPTIPNAQYLGTVAVDTPLNITSTGALTGDSSTILALYDSTGGIVAYDFTYGEEDSTRIFGTLTEGTYYLAVADFAGNSNAPKFGFDITGGTDVGLASLSLSDGTSSYAADQAIDVGGVNWYSFSVVPAPGATALLGLGGVVGLRRRRR